MRLLLNINQDYINQYQKFVKTDTHKSLTYTPNNNRCPRSLMAIWNTVKNRNNDGHKDEMTPSILEIFGCTNDFSIIPRVV